MGACGVGEGREFFAKCAEVSPQGTPIKPRISSGPAQSADVASGRARATVDGPWTSGDRRRVGEARSGEPGHVAETAFALEALEDRRCRRVAYVPRVPACGVRGRSGPARGRSKGSTLGPISHFQAFLSVDGYLTRVLPNSYAHLRYVMAHFGALLAGKSPEANRKEPCQTRLGMPFRCATGADTRPDRRCHGLDFISAPTDGRMRVKC